VFLIRQGPRAQALAGLFLDALANRIGNRQLQPWVVLGR
jgi:hypothetical protein